MATKTITVTEYAYGSIKGLKGENESFSNLFIRLSKERGVLDKYFGILKGNIKNVRVDFKKKRERIATDFERRQNVLFRH